MSATDIVQDIKEPFIKYWTEEQGQEKRYAELVMEQWIISNDGKTAELSYSSEGSFEEKSLSELQIISCIVQVGVFLREKYDLEKSDLGESESEKEGDIDTVIYYNNGIMLMCALGTVDGDFVT